MNSRPTHRNAGPTPNSSTAVRIQCTYVRAVDLRILGSENEVVSVRIIQLHVAILA